MTKFSRAFTLLLIVVSSFGPNDFASDVKADGNLEQGLNPILSYISSNWDSLTRSMSRCDSVVDPKLPERAVLYLPKDFAEPESVKQMQQSCKVHVEHLPATISHPGQIDVNSIEQHGLLYLPHSYVVPGGRFNEMYGWDSYFIILGLVKEGRIDLARGMVDNFLFEIENYGTVLNANRTYYLTRSQPPFLTSMIRSVYESEKTTGHPDRSWLEHAYAMAAKDYENWTHDPHVAGSTGLSRYFDYGEGPAAESLQDESGAYRKVAAYFVTHPEYSTKYLLDVQSMTSRRVIGSSYQVRMCDNDLDNKVPTCDPASTVALSSDYYKGDRSMRESGFDISFRFGPYGAATHHFAPVCLNSLLYKTEKDLEAISHELGRSLDEGRWRTRGEARKQLMNQYFWDEKQGLFYDYNFDTRSRSTYDYATAYYPLWVGMATPEQAQASLKRLSTFERSGGMAMSPHETGVQWDYPYGWAPLQLITVEGLRRYGFNADADRISYEFLSTVVENYRREGTIREKYNVETRSSELHVSTGYQANVIGFGWTNGVFLQLLHELPPGERARLGKNQSHEDQHPLP